ncbi:hypothetical protein ACWDAF_29640, partial [Streptomyces sp. NPDC001226]
MSPVASGPLDLDKLFAARLHAARVRPYLATALFALHTVESRSVPTMAVDRDDGGHRGVADVGTAAGECVPAAEPVAGCP